MSAGLGLGVIVAARTDSRRLPGKALLPLAGLPCVVYLLRRLASSRAHDGLVLATTDRSVDDELTRVVEAEGVPVFRGATHDVVGRYVAAARQFGFGTVARVTADCPFLDGATLDHCLAQCRDRDGYDLATTKGQFPVGLDVEIYHADQMAALDAGDALGDEDREHLTLHLYRHPEHYRLRRLTPPTGWPTTGTPPFLLDTPEDYATLANLAARLSSPLAPMDAVLDRLR